jgi:hypothetical protein
MSIDSPDNPLSTLIFLRDILTERFLRVPGRLSLVPQDRRLSVLRTLGFDVSIPGFNHSNGLVGFGVGQESPTTLPELLIFAGKEVAGAARLHKEFRDIGVPVAFYGGVAFRACAGARPVEGGHSIGYGSTSGEAGTMGCVVKERSSTDLFALSCNHVIADHNNARKGSDKVWAPGPKKLGTPAVGPGTQKDELGVVHDYAQIDFTAGATNLIDAAIAKPNNAADLDPQINGIGAPSGSSSSIAFGDKVRKSGAASGLTTGKYRYQINAEIEYNNGQKALFRDLLGIVSVAKGNFAEQGDSGAVLVDDKNAVVGQVISVAAGIDLTLGTLIQTVLDHFRVDIA